MSDDELLGRFERLELSGRDFRHPVHVRLAWIYLRTDGFAPGAARFVAHFQRFVERIGARPKYHETITWFYLAVINERLAGRGQETWDAFAAANPDLLDPGLGLLRARYPAEVLESPLARRAFILPR